VTSLSGFVGELEANSNPTLGCASTYGAKPPFRAVRLRKSPCLYTGVRRCASGSRSDGGGLHLLIQPHGGRYWRYNYRFEGKQKTLALGIYPDVSLDKARARHKEAKRQLADGIDPSIQKRALGKRAFGITRMTLRDV